MLQNTLRNSSFVLTPMAAALIVVLTGRPMLAFAEDTKEASTDDSKVVQQVEVTGIRASLQKSLDRKRNADGVTEVVSAEDIGKMADKNVADALQKLPGIVTQSGAAGGAAYDENDRVSMRGSSPSLTLTTINGHSVASTDWDPAAMLSSGAAARSVSYSLLPSEIVNQVVVHKSASADQVEGGVAGSVDIITRRPLEFKRPLTAEGSIQEEYSDLSKKSSPNFTGLFNWKNEANTAGFLLQVFDQKRQLRTDSQGYDWGTVKPTSAAGQSNNGQLAGAYYVTNIRNTLFLQDRHRTGMVFDTELKLSPDFSVNLNAFDSKLDSSYVQNILSISPGNSINGGIIPINFTLNNNILTGGQFNNKGNATGISFQSQPNPVSQAKTDYVDLAFKYRVNDKLKLNGQAGQTKSTSQADLYASYVHLPNTATSFVYSGPNSPVNVSFPNGIDTTNLTPNPGNSNSDNSASQQTSLDKESYGNFDVAYDLNSGVFSSLKFGLRVADHDREGARPKKAGAPVNATNNGAGAVSSIPQYGGTNFPGNFGKNIGSALGTSGVPFFDPGQVVSWVNATLSFDPVYNLPVSGVFKVKENNSAAYAMTNLEGDYWRGDFGLRFVKTSDSITTNTGLPCGVPSTTNGITYGSPAQATACAAYVPAGAALTIGSRFGNFYTATTDSSYHEVLPSGNLAFDVNKELVLRLGAAKVMSRPDYSALGSTFSGFAYNAAGAVPSTAVGGNPKLGPVVANNYNLGVEWYFQPRSLLSAQVFVLDFKSLISSGSTNQVLLNTAVPLSLGGPQLMNTLVSSPVMATGKSKGLELGLEQPVWGGFGVNANFSIVEAREENGLPIIGSSKDSGTVGGYFENEGWSARLMYSYRSKQRDGLFGAQQTYTAASGNLAASIGYNVNQQLSIALEGLNLNNPVYRNYNAPSATIPFETTTGFYSSGRQFYLGLRYKL